MKKVQFPDLFFQIYIYPILKKIRRIVKHYIIKTHYFIRKTIRKTLETFWIKRDISTWFYGLLIGICVGYLVIFFRLSIQTIQHFSFWGFHEKLMNQTKSDLLYWFLLTPFIGGLLITGLLYLGKKTKWLTEEHPLGVSEVIEARALKQGKIKTSSGIYSALISITALGFGASTGQEGPAVHLGASFASMLKHKLQISPRISRTLLACGSAAAVSASFNAPLAGVIFALEVILGHYALRVIAPVTIAGVTASLVIKAHFGANPAFFLPDIHPNSLYDFPASVFLGLFAALLAIIFVKWSLYTPELCTYLAKKTKLPNWALPIFGGLGVGLFAIFFPQILGVGYEAITQTLKGQYSLLFLLLLIPVKVFISGWCTGCRFGSGVFSPSVYLGIMLGSSFGALIALLPGISSGGQSFYAIVGMGAVSGAVLGAPISTTLIAFELTASYETAIAVMVAVSIATIIVQTLMGGNFFQKQIAQKGYSITEGPHRVILQTIRVHHFMTYVSAPLADDKIKKTFLYEDDTLGRAFGFLNTENLKKIPVRSRKNPEIYLGYITHSDALIAYNHALVEDHQERSS